VLALRVVSPALRLTASFARIASALAAAALVASCEPGATSAVSTRAPDGRGVPATAADVSVERVVLQAYRAIADRHILTPDFRQLSAETYRGFTSGDPALSLDAGDKVFAVYRDGRQVLSRTAPSDVTDGRAWGSMLAELFSGSLEASPALKLADRQTLIKQAMTATTRQLDRNSRYADPDEARENRFQRDGGGGIGITVERVDERHVVVRNVQDGGPAAKAGIRAEDRIVEVDGEPIGDRPLSEVVRRLRGTIGAPIQVTLFRPAEQRNFSVAFKRARIVPTTVAYERRGDTAFIRLTGFNTATTENLRSTIERARADIGRDMAGLIVDMRGNRGGLLDQAVSVSEVFLGDGLIFATQGRHPDSRRSYRGSGRKSGDLPVVVLLNGQSASAAEIVAAALQDRGRAAIVGSTSYGKGTVQTVVRLANEGELVLTWSRLHAPSGYTWNELGVMPNICTSKVGDIDRLAADAAEANRSTLVRWHAARNPTTEEVAQLRQNCPPADGLSDRDVAIATKLLQDRDLYARAVRAGTDPAYR